MLNVMVGEEWPSISLTTLVGTPDAIVVMSDVQVLSNRDAGVFSE
jgi:hypothetical protein